MKINTLKKQKFIERAQFVHNNMYDYTNVIYKSSSKKVKIGCPKHGIFLQAPTQHLEGHGCIYCKYKRMTREEFMAYVTKLYGDKYDYSKCTYTHKNGQKDNITITCKIHGDFIKSIKQHLNGQGCEKCSMEEWKRAKLIEKQNTVTSSVGEPKEDDINLTFSVSMEFQPDNSNVIGVVSAASFDNKAEAEKFLGNLRVAIELTDSKITETIVTEEKESFVDYKIVALIIKSLFLKTYEDYLKWWDKTRPSQIPRNLHECYPNFKQFFNGNEVGLKSTVRSAIILPDDTGRKSA